MAISSSDIMSCEITIVNNNDWSSGGSMLLSQNAIVFFDAYTVVTIAHT